MSRLKSVMWASLAVLVLGALASTPALATTAGWMANGTLLSGSKALETAAKVDQEFVLSGAGLTIKCTGSTLNAVAPTISSPNKGSASSITFTSCKASAPCELATTSIGTAPVATETTLEGTLATITTIKPSTGTRLSTFEVLGETCAAAGMIAVNGQDKLLSPEGQDENTQQLIKSITTEASKELFIGKSAASLTGSALLRLCSGERWSLL
jgi:hypothetical protein